jgi:hypothetical protein
MSKAPLDYIAGNGSADKVRNYGVDVLSRATGISKENLTKKRPSLVDRYGSKIVNVLTRPFSRVIRYESASKKSDDANAKLLIQKEKDRKNKEKNDADEKKYRDIQEGRSWTFM